MLNRPKPVVLLILDGFGYSLDQQNNAIAMANTSCWDQLQKDCPITLPDCSGRSVGLPDEQMVDKVTGQPYTAHTTKPVPLVHVCGDKPLTSGGGLSALAPAIPAISCVEQAAEMAGKALIIDA